MIEPGKPADTPKDLLRAMQILCGALITGIVFMSVIIVVLNLVNEPALKGKGKEFKDIFLYGAIGIALVCWIMSRTIYNKKLLIIKNSAVSLTDKLNEYRAALISYMAPCEGAALFSVIVFFMTGQYPVLIITAVMLAAMYIKMPLQKKVISELNLDWKEQQELARVIY
jgi:hypothetical protein